jgi:hypothetical protein
MRLSQLPAEWRERILEQRRKDHAAARFFVEACKIGSVELFCDAVDRMRDDAIGGDAWRVAFKGLRPCRACLPKYSKPFFSESGSQARCCHCASTIVGCLPMRSGCCCLDMPALLSAFTAGLAHMSGGGGCMGSHGPPTSRRREDLPMIGGRTGSRCRATLLGETGRMAGFAGVREARWCACAPTTASRGSCSLWTTATMLGPRRRAGYIWTATTSLPLEPDYRVSSHGEADRDAPAPQARGVGLAFSLAPRTIALRGRTAARRAGCPGVGGAAEYRTGEAAPDEGGQDGDAEPRLL